MTHRQTGCYLFTICFVQWFLVVFCTQWPCLSRDRHVIILVFLVSHVSSLCVCLQHLSEAKKAQQSLESTYKQLDSVSLFTCQAVSQ